MREKCIKPLLFAIMIFIVFLLNFAMQTNVLGAEPETENSWEAEVYALATKEGVTLKWGDTETPDAVNYHYEIRRKADGRIVQQGTVNGTSVTITGLSGNPEQYGYFVRGQNADGIFTPFSEARVPSLVVYQKSNYAKAEWAIEMLDADVVTETSFEEGQFRPSFTWKGTNGGQSYTTEEAYEGLYSIKIVDTYTNGNHYNFPDTSSIKSIMNFGKVYFPNGMDLSVSFHAKTTGTGILFPFGDGGWGETILYHNAKVAETAPKGSKTVKLDSLSGISLGNYITTDTTDSPVQNVYQIMEIDTENKIITLNKELAVPLNKGEQVRYRPWRKAYSFSDRNLNENRWTLFNINTKVNDYSDYDVLKRGGTFYFNSWTKDIIYLDNVKFGYATKAELYRDGEKVYEGFLSDYDDYAAVDKAKPDKVSYINVGGQENQVHVTFDEPLDHGTDYIYQVRAVSHDGEYLSSSIVPVTITSGIKGYSYVIDSKPDTVPDDVVDVTSPEIIQQIDPNKKNYIHIKAIDNQGNASDVYHQEINLPVLTATPVPEGDYIHLDWYIKDGSKDYIYMVYKRAEGEDEYQSIPIKDRIKVLEVYPYTPVLRDWTDAYGMGKITTHSIPNEQLNENPDVIWDYDVVVLGFADSNNKKTLTDNARIELEKFVEQGRGLLLGHDTVYPDANRTNYVQLAEKYLNMDAYNKGNWYNGVPDRNDSGAGGTSTIVITRKGFLTNYPHKIGDVGTKLVVPYSHTSYQFAKGDIWMRYDDDNMTDPYNFYLTTWNNVAMAQTGHSIRKDNDTEEWATPDEQKLIVNTLFYLAQISDVTEWDDHTGQDVTGPTQPVIQQVKLKNNGGTVYVKYNASEDQGTKYYYYVEGMAENTLVRSNVADATITTGLKGYSIVVDENPDTVPDNIIETTGLEYEIHETFNREFFVHVAAVDNVGNISEVAHYRFTDDKTPSLIVTGNPTEWTKEDVVLKATAYDEDSGVKRIQLPDGSYVYSDVATFTVTQNGTYMFTAEDNFGNKTTVTVVVNRIDKTGPSASLIINNDDLYTNKRNVTLTIHATDNATGVSLMRFRPNDGSWTGWIPYATTHSFTLEDKQGTNYVYGQFQDGIGNTSDTVYDTIIYDSVPPEGAIKYHRSVINSRNVNLTIDAYDVNPYQADKISGVDAVRFRELADGAVVKDWTSWESYQPARNWLFSEGDGKKTIEMEIRDKAGNIGRVSKTFYLDTLFIDKAEFIDIVNPPLGNPPLPTSDIVKIKKGYDFTFVVQTTGDPDEATYSFHGQSGTMRRLSENLFIQTLRLDVHDDTAAGLIPIYITVTRNSDGAQKSTTLKVHVEGSAYNDYDINLTN